MLQLSVTVANPGQLAPPLACSTCTSLVFVCTPPPQVLEQSPYVQGPHSQSTPVYLHILECQAYLRLRGPYNKSIYLSRICIYMKYLDNPQGYIPQSQTIGQSTSRHYLPGPVWCGCYFLFPFRTSQSILLSPKGPIGNEFLNFK